jgi:hypothetical protein
MRREPDFFGEEELALVYIARKLNEAVRLEEIFTASGLDYLVEPDTYSGGTIFKSERVGAFFYVAPRDEENARVVLAARGFRAYEVGG